MRAVENEIINTLAERAAWYRGGCEGLEDREAYYVSGDCARDAARDLEAALSEIRVLERVIVMLRESRGASSGSAVPRTPQAILRVPDQCPHCGSWNVHLIVQGEAQCGDCHRSVKLEPTGVSRPPQEPQEE